MNYWCQTTRNEPTEHYSQKKTIIQISAQHQPNYDEEKQRFTVSLEKNDTYNSIATAKIFESTKGKCWNRIIGIGDLKDWVDATLCRSCYEKELDTIEANTVLEFVRYRFESKGTMIPSDNFSFFKRNKRRNKKGKLDFFPKAKMLVRKIGGIQGLRIVVHMELNTTQILSVFVRVTKIMTLQLWATRKVVQWRCVKATELLSWMILR